MNKAIFCWLITAILSMDTMAQSQALTLKDVEWEVINSSEHHYKSINGHSLNFNQVKLEDGSTVALIINKKGEFAASVITPEMNFKWQTNLEGYPFGLGRFKGKILVIAAQDKTYFESYDNNYLAYLIDPLTGKVVLQKQIYSGSKEFTEFPNFMFSEVGDYFKFSVRESSFTRKIHIGLPGIAGLISIKRAVDQLVHTRSFALYDLKEDLTIEKTDLKLNGTLAGVVSNKKGDVFVMSLVEKNAISVGMLENGKKEFSKVISQPFDATLKGWFVNLNIIQNFHYTDCLEDPFRVYWSMMIGGSDGSTLIISSLDFKDGTYKMEKVHFNKAKLASLKKSYLSLNKEIDRPYFGHPKTLTVRSVQDQGNRLYVTVGVIESIFSDKRVTYTAWSEIFAAFNTDLKSLYQQSIPRFFSVAGKPMNFRDVSYDYSSPGIIRFIANNSKGIFTYETIYGELSTGDGKMLRLGVLPKENIDKKAVVNSPSIIWNKSNFIVPYFEYKGLIKTNFEVSLSSYNY